MEGEHEMPWYHACVDHSILFIFPDKGAILKFCS